MRELDVQASRPVSGLAVERGTEHVLERLAVLELFSGSLRLSEGARDVSAASADLTQARAARWPRVSLAGSIGRVRFVLAPELATSTNKDFVDVDVSVPGCAPETGQIVLEATMAVHDDKFLHDTVTGVRLERANLKRMLEDRGFHLFLREDLQVRRVAGGDARLRVQVVHRVVDRDRRLADVETYVTSSNSRLAREIEQLR